jgi:site-specific recombinase XerD
MIDPPIPSPPLANAVTGVLIGVPFRPSRADFAMMRAALQGVAADTVRDRFGDAGHDYGDEDPRTTLDRVKKRLQQFALLHQRPGEARTLSPAALATPNGIAHALDALKVLDTLPAFTPPAPALGDAPAQWFPPRLAAPLARAGITSLFALIQKMDAGLGWYRQIDGLGKGGGRFITAWLERLPTLLAQARRTAMATLTASDSHALAVAWPTRTMREWYAALPTPLTGTIGHNRAPSHDSLLNADDDYAALDAWMMRWEINTTAEDEEDALNPACRGQDRRSRSPRPRRNLTARAYRKEIERLLIWCVAVHGKAFSSLKTEDAYAFRDFLLHPPTDWQGARQRRDSPHWRPFVKPLSAKSVAYALCIINAWANYLLGKCYLKGNPFGGVTVPTDTEIKTRTTKCWTPAEWPWIARALNHLDATEAMSEPSRLRLRLVMQVGYSTGLRPQELVDATLGDIIHDGGRWAIRVLGKGRKRRTLPIPSTTMLPLIRYLIIARGISSDPATWRGDAPLIAALGEERAEAAITTRSLLAHIKRLLAVVHKIAPASVAARISQGTTHWLRHTFATTMLEHNVAPAVLLDLMGHASLATQRIYTDTDERLRAREVERIFGTADVI